jgi:glucuronate isomerase
MQIHPGVLRDHNSAIWTTYGSDKGYDIPVQTEFTRALRPMLDRFGTDPRVPRHPLHCRRDFLQPGTGPDRRHLPFRATRRSMVVPGLPGGHAPVQGVCRRNRRLLQHFGFVDDTQAYASIPARHDPFRRVDAGYLARLVLEHRLSMDEAVETAIELTYNLPKESYPAPLSH